MLQLHDTARIHGPAKRHQWLLCATCLFTCVHCETNNTLNMCLLSFTSASVIKSWRHFEQYREYFLTFRIFLNISRDFFIFQNMNKCNTSLRISYKGCGSTTEWGGRCLWVLWVVSCLLSLPPSSKDTALCTCRKLHHLRSGRRVENGKRQSRKWSSIRRSSISGGRQVCPCSKD